MMWNVKGSFPSYEIMSHIYSRSSLILNSVLMHHFVKLFKMSKEGRKEEDRDNTDKKYVCVRAE